MEKEPEQKSGINVGVLIIIIAVLVLSIYGIYKTNIQKDVTPDNTSNPFENVEDVENVENVENDANEEFDEDFYNNQEEVTSALSSTMDKLYEGVSEDSMPMMLGNTVLTKENIEYYVGTSDFNFKDALASESKTGSIAHSVVLIQLENEKDASDVVKKIKASADPRKWICVEASNVSVKSKGDLVLLVMSDETLAPIIESNFEKI